MDEDSSTLTSHEKSKPKGKNGVVENPPVSSKESSESTSVSAKKRKNASKTTDICPKKSKGMLQ